MPDKTQYPTDSLILRSPAKVNLFLHITGRYNNGFHSLETIFQFADFSDTLEFVPNRGPGVVREDKHPFSLPRDDLVIKAARLLADTAGIDSPPGTSIVLNKRIPPGSGLGGGSSNAATTLIGLNKLWKLGFSIPELVGMAATLGADVPVFIHGQTCWATGTGDRFTNFDVPPQWFCLWIPAAQVSTADIFSHPDLVRNHPPVGANDFYRGACTNDLEAVTRLLYPEVDQAMRVMSQYGEARMNGSGSSIFITCESRENAELIRRQLPDAENIVVVAAINDLASYRMLQELPQRES